MVRGTKRRGSAAERFRKGGTQTPPEHPSSLREVSRFNQQRLSSPNSQLLSLPPPSSARVPCANCPPYDVSASFLRPCILQNPLPNPIPHSGKKLSKADKPFRRV